MTVVITAVIAVKPEHSLYNAIFWLLVLLAMLIGVLAIKIAFGIVDREIELWRLHPRKRRRKPVTPAKRHHPEKEEGLY